MRLPRWLCHLLFANCKWAWVQNGFTDRGTFAGRYVCRRCGDLSHGAPRNAFTGELP